MKAWIFASVGLRSVGYKWSGIEICKYVLVFHSEYGRGIFSEGKMPAYHDSYLGLAPGCFTQKVRWTKLRCQNVAQSSCRFLCHLSFCQYVKFISHLQCFATPSTSHKNVKFAPPPPAHHLPCFVPFLTSMPDEKGGGEASCNGMLSVSVKNVFYRVI
jgi:hypothetical protein